MARPQTLHDLDSDSDDENKVFDFKALRLNPLPEGELSKALQAIGNLHLSMVEYDDEIVPAAPWTIASKKYEDEGKKKTVQAPISRKVTATECTYDDSGTAFHDYVYNEYNSEDDADQDEHANARVFKYFDVSNAVVGDYVAAQNANVIAKNDGKW